MPQSRYRRNFGDRTEGRLVRSLTPYNKLAPFLVKNRSGASNYFEDNVEITRAERFIRKKRAEGLPNLSMLHLLIAAYVRTTAMYPALNRFVSGRRIFSRHAVEVVVPAKRSLHSETAETLVKVQFDPTDTIYDVYRRIDENFDALKADGGFSRIENAATTLLKFPRLILSFVVGGLKFLDYFGRLPRSILLASPFHGSMIIAEPDSNVATPAYHHLHDFGNLPLSLSFGRRHRVMELSAEGTPEENNYMDYNFVLDERICNGNYYASAMRLLKHFLKNPHLLEQPPEKVFEDIF